ncbi:hypothetical protein [Streptomyces sp. NPDC001502]|uniref:hypothetical protein n=1 Tax=Streptomyces sp. NPDC001502 TaxID=3364578 RepID=UPI0036C0EA74
MTGHGTRSRAAAATAVLVSCALLLTGCGIKRTGVIDSGHAATVRMSGGNKSNFLYFVSKEGDRLVPSPFSLSEGYRLNPVVLLRLLLDGPRGRAGEVGLTTALPQLPVGQEEQLAVSPYTHDGTTVRVPFAVGNLSDLARMQLVCTIGAAVVTDTLSPVVLQGSDTTLPAADCERKR